MKSKRRVSFWCCLFLFSQMKSKRWVWCCLFWFFQMKNKRSFFSNCLFWGCFSHAFAPAVVFAAESAPTNIHISWRRSILLLLRRFSSHCLHLQSGSCLASLNASAASGWSLLNTAILRNYPSVATPSRVARLAHCSARVSSLCCAAISFGGCFCDCVLSLFSWSTPSEDQLDEVFVQIPALPSTLYTSYHKNVSLTSSAILRSKN